MEGGDRLTRSVGKLNVKSYKRRMAQINISISDTLRSRAKRRVDEGDYSSTSDTCDHRRRDHEAVEPLHRLACRVDAERVQIVRVLHKAVDPLRHL